MKIEKVDQLHVYQIGFEAAMGIHEITNQWPREERYALTDHVRRSSRAVCANLSEAWAKRRYPNHFVSKLTDAHGEAEETLTWLRFARVCKYVQSGEADNLSADYRRIIAGLVRMIGRAEVWGVTAHR